MLTQLTTVKARLAIPAADTTNDALITSAIASVTARFDKQITRTLARRARRGAAGKNNNFCFWITEPAVVYWNQPGSVMTKMMENTCGIASAGSPNQPSLNHSWIHIRKSLILLSCVWPIGCRSYTHTSQQAKFLAIESVPTPAQPHYDPAIPRPLSDNDLQDLVNAVRNLALSGTPFPDDVLQRIKPLEIYNDLANVVVALSRNAHEEQGYYIVTPYSSYLPAGHVRGFSWERVEVSRASGTYSEVYVYRRTR